MIRYFYASRIAHISIFFYLQIMNKNIILLIFIFLLQYTSFAQLDTTERKFCEEIRNKNFSAEKINELAKQGVNLNCECYFERSYLSLKSLIPKLQGGRLKWSKKYNTDTYILTPIQFAATNHNDSLLDALLNAGADPYTPCRDPDYGNSKMNQIELMAYDGDSAALLILEKHKIDLARVEAIRTNKTGIAFMFLERKLDPKKIIINEKLIASSSEKDLEQLMKSGTNISSLNYKASEFIKLPQVKKDLLLSNNFSCDQIDFFKCGRELALRYVDEFPACINSTADGSKRPIYLISFIGDTVIVGKRVDKLQTPLPIDKLEMMKNKGADPSVRCSLPAVYGGGYNMFYPQNLYEQAIYTNDEALLRWLIKEKVAVDLTDSYSRSPIFEAISMDNLLFVKLLVEAGMSLDVKYWGKTPLKFAKKYKKKEIYAYLKSVKKKK